MENHKSQSSWSESLSKQFVDYGRYFVPDRDSQMKIMTALLSNLGSAASIVELCCGEGLLAEVILEVYPTYSMQAFDGSSEMLARAQNRLSRFKDRFQCQKFELASTSWRHFNHPVNAVVSSLAIHHLTGPQKQVLFRDIFRILIPGRSACYCRCV